MKRWHCLLVFFFKVRDQMSHVTHFSVGVVCNMGDAVVSEPKAQVHYCHHALTVIRRPSVVNCFIFSASSLNSTKLDRKEDHNVLYQVCVFWPIRKIRWPPWSLSGWDIFDFFSKTADRHSTRVDWKQDLNILYQVYVFWANRKIRWPH